MRKMLLGVVLLGTACSGGGSGTAAPMPTATQAVSAFFRAAADSNLNRMAELWPLSGSAAKTSAEDYQKRLSLLQVFVRADSSRILSDEPVSGDNNRRRLAVAIWRSGCMKQVPVTSARSGTGWIVQNVEIAYAGNPARPCEPATPQ